MSHHLKGKRVAIIATHGFEQSELEEPKAALEQAGAETHVISLKAGAIRGWKGKDWGSEVSVDHTLEQVNPADYDGLLLPGGLMNPDTLRREEHVLNFVRAIAEAGKPIAAICHGPWTLIDAGLVKGRLMTSYPTLQSDLKNAGAEWVDREVVVDNGLVTSRNPNDIPAFNRKFIEELGEGIHKQVGQ
ncbi:type 1 glutamine amidotransferase domain-containing protein [Herpetosiphon geysericola]|uniref:Glutamine amidotransferase n=1 Tax=Herpetosiphon geysericola TaxID=70996 RepID=A0A0P6XZS3_9CHLR|nr:type 1 glutamine amidotransferase domain-containing protein [Herpetosiphon geysericola]KPL90513.1 glutamine amidotransferase [Herpetosiphon geysericola]